MSPLEDNFVSLFKVTPLSQCTYLGGGTKTRICPTTLERFKMASLNEHSRVRELFDSMTLGVVRSLGKFAISKLP